VKKIYCPQKLKLLWKINLWNNVNEKSHKLANVHAGEMEHNLKPVEHIIKYTNPITYVNILMLEKSCEIKGQTSIDQIDWKDTGNMFILKFDGWYT